MTLKTAKLVFFFISIQVVILKMSFALLVTYMGFICVCSTELNLQQVKVP